MNTSKQINIMVLMVFLSIMVTAVYMLWDPNRSSEAGDEQLDTLVWRGSYLFSQNCAACHGDAGEGGLRANRFRLAPELDKLGDEFQGDDFDQQKYATEYKRIFYTITCGRVGKQMPTWGQSQGGTLNEEQIRQLTTLILRGGPDGWDQSKEFAYHGVPDFNVLGYDRNHLKLAQPLDESSTTLVLDKTTGAPPAPGETPPQVVNPKERLQIGGPEEADIDVEIMTVTAVDTATNTVTVERGVGTTSPKAHEPGVLVYQPIVPPTDPPIIQAACGQTAAAPQPTGTPPPAASALQITAQGTAWNTALLTGLPNVPLTITVDNKDDGTIHDWHLTQGATAGGDEIPNGSAAKTASNLQPGPNTQTLNFGPLAPGEYYYFCDVHPSMEGVLTVVEPGGAPPAGVPPAGATSVPASGGATPAAAGTGTPAAAATGTLAAAATGTPAP